MAESREQRAQCPLLLALCALVSALRFACVSDGHKPHRAWVRWNRDEKERLGQNLGGHRTAARLLLDVLDDHVFLLGSHAGDLDVMSRARLAAEKNSDDHVFRKVDSWRLRRRRVLVPQRLPFAGRANGHLLGQLLSADLTLSDGRK